MKDYRMHYSDQACPSILARNARTASRAHAACNVIFAVVLAVLGAAALVHYLTPCETGQLCALAVVQTRPGLLSRIRRGLRRYYLRVLIAAHEQDVLRHEAQAILEPALAQIARDRAAELRVELAQL